MTTQAFYVISPYVVVISLDVTRAMRWLSAASVKVPLTKSELWCPSVGTAVAVVILVTVSRLTLCYNAVLVQLSEYLERFYYEYQIKTMEIIFSSNINCTYYTLSSYDRYNYLGHTSAYKLSRRTTFVLNIC